VFFSLEGLIMKSALLFPACQRWRVSVAFIFAIALHVTAVSLAHNRAAQAPMALVCPFEDTIEGTEDPPAAPETTPISEETPRTQEDAMFSDETHAQQIRPRNRVRPIAKGIVAPTRSTNLGSVKALALFAPKPDYPYEARRQRVTGSGTATLSVDQNGYVEEASMEQTTGSPILDNAALSAFRRWRFKGPKRRINVPITYTLVGPIY
jgi:TonB family protein